MLYATIRALGSLPSVALSSPMAVVLYPFMLLPKSVKSKRVAGFIFYQPTNFFAVESKFLKSNIKVQADM